jgi:hypothetical protein
MLLTDYDATSAGRTNVNAAVKGILEGIDRAQTSDD